MPFVILEVLISTSTMNTKKGSPLTLDTLAQSPQAAPTKGSSAGNLKKRARSKYFTQGFVRPLLELDSPLNKQYKRAYNCAEVVRVESGKTRTHYCNSRVCNVCNRIRTAKAINGYKPHFEKGEPSVFITLTAPTVEAKEANELRQAMRQRVNAWNNIRKLIIERMGLPIQGITKREITYTKGKYHPHLHIILKCEGYELDLLAEFIIEEWLKRNPTARRQAQDHRPTDEETLNELFKYTTKQAKRKKNVLTVNPQSIDVIMRALNKTRTFQPFGGLRKISEEINEIELISEDEPVNVPDGYYFWNLYDWYHYQTGHALSGYNSPLIEFHVQNDEILQT
jgi:hypothetical protein